MEPNPGFGHRWNLHICISRFHGTKKEKNGDQTGPKDSWTSNNPICTCLSLPQIESDLSDYSFLTKIPSLFLQAVLKFGFSWSNPELRTLLQHLFHMNILPEVY
jgi:hypothetical protein